ncbi:MAG: hypothetical protein FJZ01_05355 [Candidatus Sericytochromatia bacterium]|nr:hypothetical protein [Candidatus Tanganyikabacteria bacterium]
MTGRAWGLLAGLILAAGCQRGGAPGLARHQAFHAVPPRSEAEVAARPVEGHARLLLTLHWPERAPYRPALIPSDTETLRVVVSTGTETLAAEEFGRPVENDTQVVDLALRAASNVTVEIFAYREARPLPAGARHIAKGTASGLNLVVSRTTQARITLVSLSTPIITRFDVNAARIGETVKLTGDNFQPGDPILTFNGATASDVVVESATALRATIPDGATVGPVRVRVGNQLSPSANFWVASDLAIGAPKSSWDPTAAATRIVLVGKELQFSATPSFVLKSGDKLSNHGQSPMVQWSHSAAAAGTIDSAGLLSASGSIAATTVRGTLGTLSRSLAVSVEDVSVKVSPASAWLGALGNPTVQYRAMATLSGGATNDLVVWSSGEAASVSVSATGLVSPEDLVANGKVDVRAASSLLPLRTATASVLLRNKARIVSMAGSVEQGYADGMGSAARFWHPNRIVVAPGGNLLVADVANHRIRQVTPAGVVTTWAGTGSTVVLQTGGGYQSSGASWDQPKAHRLSYVLDRPNAMTFDLEGNLLVAETPRNRLRKIDKDGVVDGLSRNWESIPYQPRSLAVDKTGTLFVAFRKGCSVPDRPEYCDSTIILKETIQGTRTWLAPGGGPDPMLYDPVRDVLLGNHHGLKQMTKDGVVSWIAGVKDTTDPPTDGSYAAARFNGGGALALTPDRVVVLWNMGDNASGGYDNRSLRFLTPEGYVRTLPLPPTFLVRDMVAAPDGTIYLLTTGWPSGAHPLGVSKVVF